jgi:uncharacterized repeat protein (TIGR01451 family)
MTYQGNGAARPRIIAIRTSALIGAAVIVLSASQAQAAGTIAGTVIDNVATATFDLPGGGESTVTSNTVSLTVDELLDVTVASADPGDVSTAPGATNQVLKFTLTNAGNGSEAFKLTPQGTLGSDDFDPTVTSVVIDANSNNVYDAGVDTVYVSGTDTPALAPDTSVTIFVLSSIPAGASNGNRGRVDLAAVAATGSGSPGTSFAGQGQGGGNAVVGATGADANDDGFFVISAASVAFVKSATVSDIWGNATQVPGSTITYTLTATVSGSGAVSNLRVADPIPAGTTYKPGSIILNGGPLTDASDADAGNFGSGAVNVSLGNVAAGGSHEVKFQVVID